MLQETLEHMQNATKKEQMQNWTKFALTEVMPKIAEITQQPDFGYHGLEHTEQVVLFGIDYALSENINPIPVILACALHDCARTHDDWDDNHGPNAGPIAYNFLEEYDFGLSEDEKIKVIEAIKGHTNGENTDEKIAACLWDADRTRLAWERGGPIKSKFSTKRGLEVAQYPKTEQNKYMDNQTQILEEIKIPSYLLMSKRGQTSSNNTSLKKQPSKQSHSLKNETERDKEEQMQLWVNKIESEILSSPKRYRSKQHDYRKNAEYNGHLECLAILAADYALNAGVNPTVVVFGTLANYMNSNLRFQRTTDELIQRTSKFLDDFASLSKQDKEQIITCLYTASQEGNSAIISCIDDVEQTIKTWKDKRFTPKCSTTYAQNVAYNKEAYLQSLNRFQIPLYMEQDRVRNYNYNNTPAIGTKENPIIFYHGTDRNTNDIVQPLRDGAIKELYTTPDICYAFDRLTDKRVPDDSGTIFRGEMVGIFPQPDTSFSAQGINLPIEHICRFMKIGHPIKDPQNFIKQVVDILGKFTTENRFNRPYETRKEQLLELKNAHPERLRRINEINQELATIKTNLAEISANLNPPPKTLKEKIKSLFESKEKKAEKQRQEQNLQRELKEKEKNLSFKKRDLEAEKTKLENNDQNTRNEESQAQQLEESLERDFPDLRKLDKFLAEMNNGNNPQTKTTEEYVQFAQKMLKDFVERQSLKSLMEKFPEANKIDLVDGEQCCGDGQVASSPSHYLVYNPDTIKQTARYKISDYCITQIEKANAQGYFGELSHTTKQEAKAPVTPEQIGQSQTKNGQVMEAPRVPTQPKVNPPQTPNHIR